MTRMRAVTQRVLDIATIAVLAGGFLVLLRPDSEPRRAWSERQRERRFVASIEKDWDALRSIAFALSSTPERPRLVMVTDYECPYCRIAETVVDSAIAAGVPVSVLHLPVERTHPRARAAALFSVCAAQQRRFREAHERLVSTTEWQTDGDWGREAHEASIADTTRLLRCMRDSSSAAVLAAHRTMALKLSVRLTPTFLGAGGRIEGVPTFSALLDLAALSP